MRDLTTLCGNSTQGLKIIHIPFYFMSFQFHSFSIFILSLLLLFLQVHHFLHSHHPFFIYSIRFLLSFFLSYIPSSPFLSCYHFLQPLNLHSLPFIPSFLFSPFFLSPNVQHFFHSSALHFPSCTPSSSITLFSLN